MGHLSFGIDPAADSVAICALDEAGAVVGEVCCEATPSIVAEHLIQLGASAATAIGIEAGGVSIPLVRGLRSAGFSVRVLNARQISGFLKLTQNKTDRNDARGIADIMRLGGATVSDIMIKTEAVQLLRSELVLRERLMAQRIALENALRGTLRLNGGKLGPVFSGLHLDRQLKQELIRLKSEGTDLSELLAPAATILIALRTALERSDRRLSRLAEEIEVCRRLMSIPGIGCICALSFYTVVGDPYRFENAADVGPYLGLVPKVSQSGTMSRSGRITRMGNRMTRTHLFSAAKSMMQQGDKDSDLRRWALYLAERAGRKKAKVALARKLAVVMIAMWKSGEAFRPG